MMVRIGSVFANTGYYDLAIEYFQRAIGINPRYSEAYSSLVMTYLAMGDKNSAMNVLEDWLVVNPKDANARNMLQELRNK